MNTDGGELTRVRSENSPKSKLHWIFDNQLIYLSRNCAYLLNGDTKQTKQLICFPSNETLEGFNISPDGSRAAISVQRTLNIFPFDVDLLSDVTTRFNLLEIPDNCFYNQFSFLEVFWSKDQTQLVAHVIDTQLVDSDQFLLLNADIEHCDSVDLTRIDTIPGGRIDFDTDSTKRIGGFDWDGKNRFLFNDSIRSDGFGNLYMYDSDTGEIAKINPIDGQCCYRDARWSPDGTYILFVYQRFDSGSIEVYYAPFEDVQNGEKLTPINLPNGFFSTSREKPQPALRPAQ